MPNISLTDPQSQLAELQRRQRMAELLASQAQQPVEAGSYKGIQAHVPATANIAKILQQMMAGYDERKIGEDRDALVAGEKTREAGDYQSMLAGLLGKEQINPVNVSPEVTTPGQNKGFDYGTPGTTFEGGLMSGNPKAAQIAQMLGGMSPETGSPIAAALMGDALKTPDAKDRYMNVPGVGMVDLLAPGGPKPVVREVLKGGPGDRFINQGDAGMSEAYAIADTMSPAAEAQKVRIAGAGRAVTTNINNVGPTGIDYGEPEKGLTWKRDPNGKVMLDERGAPIGVPYQGGSVYREEQGAAAKAAAVAATRELQSDIVVTDIDRALKIVESPGVAVTGMGSMLAAVPGTRAHDVSQLLNTVKANAGFDKLQEMRNNSPTGGALGPVSDFENKLLQSTIGALEQSQTKEQFTHNAKRVKEIYSKIITEGINPDGTPRLKHLTTPPASGDTVDFNDLP